LPFCALRRHLSFGQQQGDARATLFPKCADSPILAAFMGDQPAREWRARFTFG
jgi:hypothetical protein